MKKKFNFKPIIAVAACAAFALAAIPVANHFAKTPAVQQTEAEKIGVGANFTAYETGVHEGPTIGTHKIELKLDSVRKTYNVKEKEKTEKTVKINGLEWKGEYESSKSATDYSVESDVYKSISNGRDVTFRINEKTGKCEYFIFNDYDKESDKKLSRDELFNIAYKYLISGGFTDDPENYQLASEGSNGKAGYWFKFARFQSGICTSEYVRIGLQNNGEFFWFKGNNIGEMKNIDVSEVDMDKMFDVVDKKLQTIYEDAYIGFDKNGPILTKLADGTYIFHFEVEVDVINDENKQVKDTCFLTIFMD
jgi:hypothetical protein